MSKRLASDRAVLRVASRFGVVGTVLRQTKPEGDEEVQDSKPNKSEIENIDVIGRCREIAHSCGNREAANSNGNHKYPSTSSDSSADTVGVVHTESSSSNHYKSTTLLGLLNPAEREVYEAVDQGPYGAREYARYTNRSPGTVSNLLRRARQTLGEQEGQA